MPLDAVIFGLGVYTPREAARLVGGTAQEVLRWTRGSGPTEPLWKAHYQYLEDTTELSFFDLIEVRVVKAMRLAGVSMQSIRYAIRLAANRFGVERPLATQNFRLSGRQILMDALENDGELISLSKANPGQKVFTEIVRQSLNDLEYEDDLVARWRPSAASFVVIDPQRSFGAPVLDDFGISTRVLFDEFLQCNDARYLSRVYEIPLRYINDALRYESGLESAKI